MTKPNTSPSSGSSSISSQEPTRPIKWEDDISRNHDSIAPFSDLLKPSDIEIAEYQLSRFWTVVALEEDELREILDRDFYPMPSASDREGYNAGADRDYFLSGYLDYRKVVREIDRNQVKAESILDFGCASGRVLRHFACQGTYKELWGADINGRHIQFIQEFLPTKIKAVHNSALPYFPLADSSIDVVTAFSVFTHIDTFESSWLAEIYRVLRPGGLAYITVHNDDTWREMWSPKEQRFLLKRLKATKPDIMEFDPHCIPTGRTCFRYTDIGPYRALTFHSNDYIRKTWGRFFDIKRITPLDHGRIQSVVTMMKPDRA